MFKITAGKGFQITFANGYTASVQFGVENYCANRMPLGKNPKKKDVFCANAEIAAWDSGGDYHNFGSGRIEVGYQTPEEVVEFLCRIAAKPQQ
jgi:hypothetical protein